MQCWFHVDFQRHAMVSGSSSPTYWFPSHSQQDKPLCKLEDNTWAEITITELDLHDQLNRKDGPTTNIDRHGYTAVEVITDGVADMVCIVGADRGTGNGFNEVYVTQQDDSLPLM
eukprot:scaffold94892_cov35-Attheya_sp.AAC.3